MSDLTISSAQALETDWSNYWLRFDGEGNSKWQNASNWQDANDGGNSRGGRPNAFDESACFVTNALHNQNNVTVGDGDGDSGGRFYDIGKLWISTASSKNDWHWNIGKANLAKNLEKKTGIFSQMC